MMVVTATVTTAITLVRLDAVTCMVALGALAALVVVVLRGVLGVLLDKEIWLSVWVLVWEMEVVARKVMREVPRETMIPGMWVLRRVVAVVVRWWPGPSEAHQLTPLEEGRLGLKLVVVPCGHRFSRLVVGVGVIGEGLVGALRALVRVVGAVVAVGCRRAPGVVVGGQELVLVGALPPKHIRGLSFSFS